MLTDEQCDEFRRLPLSFNDMVRAIYTAGQKEGAKTKASAWEQKHGFDKCGVAEWLRSNVV